MEKLIDNIEDRIGEVQAILGLCQTTIETVAEAISAGKLPHHELPYNALTGMDMISEKLTGIVERMYEEKKPKAA